VFALFLPHGVPETPPDKPVVSGPA
jgi:hypothetical protein